MHESASDTKDISLSNHITNQSQIQYPKRKLHLQRCFKPYRGCTCKVLRDQPVEKLINIESCMLGKCLLAWSLIVFLIKMSCYTNKWKVACMTDVPSRVTFIHFFYEHVMLYKKPIFQKTKWQYRDNPRKQQAFNEKADKTFLI